MKQPMDLTGRSFGNWTVLRSGESTVKATWSQPRWLCRCSCGLEKQVFQNSLVHGKSTGCGKSHKQSGGDLYRIWAHIKNRCGNPRVPAYPDYGGRGIVVCERWVNDFNAFASDVGPRPSKSHSIDRIDVNGNYEPGNVRWATETEQARNKRSARTLTIDGVTRTMGEWSEVAGISVKIIWQRDQYGWTPRECVYGRPRKTLSGESNPSSRLTEADVAAIRARHAGGASIGEIARDYPVSRDCIGKIVSRTNWRHVA